MLVMVGDVEMVATCKVLSVTVSVTPLNVAEMVVVPGALTAVTKPGVPTVAMLITDDAQFAKDVRFCTTLLASVPSAWNCCVMVGAMLFGDAGDRDNETTSDVERRADPVMPLYTAVMTAEPVNVPAVTRPLELTVAIPGSEELQVAREVRITVVLFE